MTDAGSNGKVAIVGAGLAGSLLAVYLARRGIGVDMYEQLPDSRREEVPAGRSINLALAERGIHALQRAGVYGDVSKFAIPMRGRMVHELEGTAELQPYSINPDEVIYAAHRARLNQVLLDAAERAGDVTIHFRHKLVDGDLERGELVFEDAGSGKRLRVRAGTVFGADGAGSPLRELVEQATGTKANPELLDHGYKELTVPPADNGDFRLEPNALHIWPRGGYMLIALPNTDCSFTATLFLPDRGEPGFDHLKSDEDVRQFFDSNFADVVPHIPNLTREFRERPTGILGTVRCSQWHYRGRALLLGDAAHAIVPFHGQGMNCAFEDCEVLDDILDSGEHDWARAFDQFQQRRVADCDAIADMALENYVEMRDSVRDPHFKLKKRIAALLQRRHPRRFVPRYSLVMFRRLPYAEARRRGTLQQEILERLADGIDDPGQADMALADKLVNRWLKPLEEAG